MTNTSSTSCVTYSGLPNNALQSLLTAYSIEVIEVATGATLEGSHWGEPEAGLVGNRLYVRAETPVHSALHEACHYVCMDQTRRSNLDTDAGGDYDEENGVCYLQLLLAEKLKGFSRQRSFEDMDSWGYSFRLGSTQAWFEQDAEDAFNWLQQHQIISPTGELTKKLRQ